MNVQEIQLQSGAVLRCRPVPPYLMGELFESLPPPPAFPQVSLESPATPGTAQTAHALPGSPEYDQYRLDQQEWTQLRNRQFTNFSLDYGCIEWSWGDDQWTSTPPEDWIPDPVLERYGMLRDDTPRLLYIKSELIITDADMAAVEKITGGQAPLKEDEVKAALVPFDSTEEDDQ